MAPTASVVAQPSSGARKILAIIVGVVAVAAVCAVAMLLLRGRGNSAAESTVEEFRAALAAGDAGKVQSLLHEPEAQSATGQQMSEAMAFFGQYIGDAPIEYTEVRGGRAIVVLVSEETVSTSFTGDTEEKEVCKPVALQRSDGEWRVHAGMTMSGSLMTFGSALFGGLMEEEYSTPKGFAEELFEGWDEAAG